MSYTFSPAALKRTALGREIAANAHKRGMSPLTYLYEVYTVARAYHAEEERLARIERPTTRTVDEPMPVRLARQRAAS